MGLRVATDPGMSFPPTRPPAWREHQRPALLLLQGQSRPGGVAPSGNVLWAWTPASFPSTGLALQKEGQSGWWQAAATSPARCRALRVSPPAEPECRLSVTPFTLERQGQSHCHRVQAAPASRAAPPAGKSGSWVQRRGLAAAGEGGGDTWVELTLPTALSKSRGMNPEAPGSNSILLSPAPEGTCEVPTQGGGVTHHVTHWEEELLFPRSDRSLRREIRAGVVGSHSWGKGQTRMR